jgi:hypothetical protein
VDRPPDSRATPERTKKGKGGVGEGGEEGRRRRWEQNREGMRIELIES